MTVVVLFNALNGKSALAQCCLGARAPLPPASPVPASSAASSPSGWLRRAAPSQRPGRPATAPGAAGTRATARKQRSAGCDGWGGQGCRQVRGNTVLEETNKQITSLGRRGDATACSTSTKAITLVPTCVGTQQVGIDLAPHNTVLFLRLTDSCSCNCDWPTSTKS